MPNHYIDIDNITVHVEAEAGDIKMLCGAYRTETVPHMKETPAQITCADCIKIINFCRTVRPGEVCSPFQRRHFR
jgi:hypothetical protein